VLSVRGLSTRDGSVKDVSLELKRGEVVGLAGLVGCGKSEIGRAIFGAIGIDKGEIEVNGKQMTRPTPRKMIDEGVCYITSDRHTEGLMVYRSVKENITLAALSRPLLSRLRWIFSREEKKLATQLGKVMAVRPFDLNRSAGAYSGGNQQKLLIARALASAAAIFVFDEPTVGVDVGARSEIYGFIKLLVEQGSAVIIISSDLPDVMNLSHRLYVVRNGQIVDHIENKSDISERRILNGFFDVQRA
jgi:ribose transport system ATP-binding protein